MFYIVIHNSSLYTFELYFKRQVITFKILRSVLVSFTSFEIQFKMILQKLPESKYLHLHLKQNIQLNNTDNEMYIVVIVFWWVYKISFEVVKKCTLYLIKYLEKDDRIKYNGHSVK